MLNGFEQYTAPLTQQEKKVLLPLIADILADAKGKENAVKNYEICRGLRVMGYSINEARVRKIINYARTKNIIPCLIASWAGYYISNDREELKAYAESLAGREMAIKSVRMAIEAQAGL